MLTDLIQVYPTLIRAHLQHYAQYRFNQLIGTVAMLVNALVHITIWRIVAQGQGGSVSGFAVGEFTAYYLILMYVQLLTVAPAPTQLSRRIQRGDLSSRLMKPLHPVHLDIAENIAYKFLTISLFIPATFVLLLTYNLYLPPPSMNTLFILPTLLLAAILRFVILGALANTAFWTTRFEGIWGMYMLLQTFFGGILAPMALMPGIVQSLGWALPFQWMFSFPVEVIMGRVDLREVLTGMMVQLTWIILGVIAARITWRAGLRRYIAVDG